MKKTKNILLLIFLSLLSSNVMMNESINVQSLLHFSSGKLKFIKDDAETEVWSYLHDIHDEIGITSLSELSIVLHKQDKNYTEHLVFQQRSQALVLSFIGRAGTVLFYTVHEKK